MPRGRNPRCCECGVFVKPVDHYRNGSICNECFAAAEHRKLMQKIRFIMIVMSVVATVLLAKLVFAFGLEYYATGVNTLTNERVVAWLECKHETGECVGTVQDRTRKLDVVGGFSGKGQFLMRSLYAEYELETAEECPPWKPRKKVK